MTGKTLRERRQEKGWTQSYVGEQVGITSVSVHDIETGKNRPSYNVLLKLCKLFNIEHGEVKGLFEPASSKQE